MSKWALFAAHRYVRAGAAVPRVVGPDGKPLLRPWRQRRPVAEQTARRIRACRPQPWWPRLAGFVCIAVALLAALNPVGPMAAHVAASASAGPGPRLDRIVVEESLAGAVARALRLTWPAASPADPVTLVAYAADYTELARRPGVVGTDWNADGELLALLRSGGTYHCLLRSEAQGQPAQSALETFIIR